MVPWMTTFFCKQLFHFHDDSRECSYEESEKGEDGSHASCISKNLSEPAFQTQATHG